MGKDQIMNSKNDSNALYDALLAKKAIIQPDKIKNKFNQAKIWRNKEGGLFIDVSTGRLWKIIDDYHSKYSSNDFAFLKWDEADEHHLDQFMHLSFEQNTKKSLSLNFENLYNKQKNEAKLKKLEDLVSSKNKFFDIGKTSLAIGSSMSRLLREYDLEYKTLISELEKLKANKYSCSLLTNKFYFGRQDELVDLIIEEKLMLYDDHNPSQTLLGNGDVPSLIDLYESIDYNRCRLPRLEQDLFFDINKGLWEFSGLDPELLTQGLRVRDPVQDIIKSNVSIDFGTSSTVVAYENINGKAQLLRIGVDDYYEEVIPEHYENPTVLEFLDFAQMNEDWTDISHQPLVAWDDVRCSHEALHNLRNNDSNPKIVSSILNNLKQWALRGKDDDSVYITDQINEYEHQLVQLKLNNPVKGRALSVDAADDFDPIELYAWFLGLNINWRHRGIFLKYYMTFPVAYSRDVKEKILSSFRRGLLRSLPAALLDNPAIEQFSVAECATEPAAYAASVMDSYEIEPTEDGIAYAVFDFGGGTTDFDFGHYRLSTDEEYDSYNIEEVFEHAEAAGDQFLGGENLLENMAYIVFQKNIELCRQEKIIFTKPLDADKFVGSELLIDKTQSARTNTLMLISKLRPIWEKNEVNPTGIESLTLLSKEGKKVTCELMIPADELLEYLESRIFLGIQSFFAAMHKAFANNMPKDIHVLLAGNSCRSSIILEAFGINKGKENSELARSRHQKMDQIYNTIFQNEDTLITFHEPLSADVNDESKPTAKTGIALGILRLCSGSSIKIIETQQCDKQQDEAPFSYYVGKIRRKLFQVGLARNARYDEWKEIGVVAEDGIFNLFYTQSDRAYGNALAMGDPLLYKRALEFSQMYVGYKIFAHPISSKSIEISLANSLEDILSNQSIYSEKLNLE